MRLQLSAWKITTCVALSWLTIYATLQAAGFDAVVPSEDHVTWRYVALAIATCLSVAMTLLSAALVWWGKRMQAAIDTHSGEIEKLQRDMLRVSINCEHNHASRHRE